jgi:hypothetical protein
MLRHVPPRLLVASAVAVGALALSFTKPPTTHGTSDLPFDDRGEFTYTGAAPGGEAVYQADTVSSGQPVFLNLVDSIDVGFTYSASSLAPVVARGDVGLRAQVSDSSGWTYPLDLAVPVHFEGTDAHVSGTLNLHDLQATIANMEAATGVKRDSYTVLISASVNREVRRSDAVVAGLFAPDLEFRLNDTEMDLATPGGNALTPSQGGLLTLPRTSANHFEILGQSLSIAAARAASLAFALLIAALWLDTFLRTAQSDETSLIERRYRNYVLPVRAKELTSELVIDVESIAALARIADHTGGPMLRHGDDDAYYVVEGPRVYRYRVLALDAVHTDVDEVVPEPRPQPVRPLRVRRRVET